MRVKVMGVTPWYCTREEIKAAIDSAETARHNRRIDRACRAATDAVHSLTRRTFYPQVETRYFDYSSVMDGRLYTGDVLHVTSIVMDGTSVPLADILLYPANASAERRPYLRIELDDSSASSWTQGDTDQHAIAVTGTWGFTEATDTAGATAEVLDDSESGIDITDSSSIGVGDLIKIDSEYMIVLGKSLLTTTQTLQTPMTASAANTSCAVTDGTKFFPDEVITLDSERMLVEEVAGNTLIVKRALDGSTLASHAVPTIYAPRTLTVERGALGSTAATHLTASPIGRHRPPPLVRMLAIGEALNALLSEESGWARTPGEGVSARPASGAGLGSLREQVEEQFGIRYLMGAV